MNWLDQGQPTWDLFQFIRQASPWSPVGLWEMLSDGNFPFNCSWLCGQPRVLHWQMLTLRSLICLSFRSPWLCCDRTPPTRASWEEGLLSLRVSEKAADRCEQGLAAGVSWSVVTKTGRSGSIDHSRTRAGMEPSEGHPFDLHIHNIPIYLNNLGLKSWDHRGHSVFKLKQQVS